MRSTGLRLAAWAAAAVFCAVPAKADAARVRGALAADAAPAMEDPWLFMGPQRANVERFALPPLDSGRLLAVLGGGEDTPLSATLFRSEESGHAWIREVLGAYSIDVAHDVAIDANGRGLAAHDLALFKRDAGAAWWNVATHPVLFGAARPERVAPGPGLDAPVWVAAQLDGEHRVYLLDHTLQAWTDVTPALPARVLPAELAVSATPGRVAVAAIDATHGVARVFITQDAGTNWSMSTPPGQMENLSTLRWVGDRLFMGGWDTVGGRAALWASDDIGASWQLRLMGAPGQFAGMDVAGDPARPDRLWAGTHEGLYHSNDGGLTWHLPQAGGLQGILRVQYDPHRGLLWAGVRDTGLWFSDNDGDTWEARNERLGAQPVVGLAVNPQDPGDVAVAIDSVGEPIGQVATSSDGGLAWAQNVAPLSRAAGKVRFAPSGALYAMLSGVQHNTLFRRDGEGDWHHVGFEWPDYMELILGDVNFGATEDTLLISARVYEDYLWSNRVWRSGNAGATWEEVLTVPQILRVAAIERVHGPYGPRLLVFEWSGWQHYPSRLWASDDDGQTWFDAAPDLPAGFQGRMCVGGAGQVLMQLLDSDTSATRLHRSEDAGHTWTQTGWNPGPGFSGEPLVAMHCPGDAQQVFIGGTSGRLWMSIDGGDSFHPLANHETWGYSPVDSIHLGPTGLYIALLSGTWLNPDINLGPSGLEVHRTAQRMRYRATLQWSGGQAQVDILRNGEVVATVDNTGHWSGAVLATIPQTTWQACNAGTNECSAEATVN